VIGLVGCAVVGIPGMGHAVVSAPSGKLMVSQENVSLADAVLNALEHNLDISVSRRTRDVRLTDIIFEQAKFDPTVSLSGRHDKELSPLNRPFFGITGEQLNSVQALDTRDTKVALGLTQKLLTGANYDLTFNPERALIRDASGFLFNPSYTSGLKLNLSQPLLRNFGLDVNRTQILIAQNQANVEAEVFRDRVLTVISTVEQSYWELVFANENLKVAKAALQAAEELLVGNRAKEEAGVIANVEVLQAEAGVASRKEQILVAEKAIRDQEDQFRRLLAPSLRELRSVAGEEKSGHERPQREIRQEPNSPEPYDSGNRRSRRSG
jgi:outer membrane protein TolC